MAGNEEILKKYKENQLSLVKSVQTIEGLLNVLYQTVNNMTGTDKWWLNCGYGHMREGMLALKASISKEPTDEDLKAFKEALETNQAKEENPQQQEAVTG
jgi:hypothetical protein